MIKDKAHAKERADIEKKAHAKEHAMMTVSVADEQRDIKEKAHAEKNVTLVDEQHAIVNIRQPLFLTKHPAVPSFSLLTP